MVVVTLDAGSRTTVHFNPAARCSVRIADWAAGRLSMVQIKTPKPHSYGQ